MSLNASEIIQFLELVGRLKHIKRTGWVHHQVKDPESVAGHMYRMGIMSFLVREEDGLDKDKCIKLSLAHDLAECIVGDLTPTCGVSPEEKHVREDKAMTYIKKLVGPAGDDIYALYKEYEEQTTPEAKFVKELDRFDMVLQAFEYEKHEQRPSELEDFFRSTRNKFSHPLITSLLAELNKQRSEFESSESTKNVSTDNSQNT